MFPLWAGRQWRQGQRRPSWTVPAVVSWAGTRGVVPLAAALSIPLTAADGTPLPQRDLLLVLAVTVIVISLITQGLTLEPLVRRTSIAQPAASTRQEEATARLRMAEAGLARLDELAASQEAPTAVIDRLRQALDARAGQARAQPAPMATAYQKRPSTKSAATSSRRRATSWPACTPTASSAPPPA